MARVAEGDFLEAHAVPVRRRAYVQMARHDDAGVESTMPIAGALGAAPNDELRDPRQPRQVLAQREVVDQDGGRQKSLKSCLNVTVNWLALYRYGMDFGNMGFLPLSEVYPYVVP